MTYQAKIWKGLAVVTLLSASGLAACKTDDWSYRRHGRYDRGWDDNGERGEGGERGDRREHRRHRDRDD